MKKTLFLAILAMAALVGCEKNIENQNDNQIDGIWYIFYDQSLTASVTHKGSDYVSSDEYTGSIVIPTSVSHNNKIYTVTSIGEYAFNYCKGLTSVTIPNSVTTIGEYAFLYCTGLTSVTLPNSVTAIGEGAFSDCSGLTSVTIPNSVTTIGSRAFHYVTNIVYSGSATFGAKCINGYVDGYLVYNNATKTILCGCSSAAIGEITIPNSVTTIGSEAFGGCSGLTSVTIPNSVTTIGNSAFWDCSGLTKTNYTGTIADWCKIEFDDNPMYYSHNFYINDVEVKDLVIPEGVTKIANEAFRDCSSLTSVTIPNSVKTIGYYAFEDCSGLTSITCQAIVPPSCGYLCFEGVDMSIPLYVPAQSEQAYKWTSEVWGYFSNIQTY